MLAKEKEKAKQQAVVTKVEKMAILIRKTVKVVALAMEITT